MNQEHLVILDRDKFIKLLKLHQRDPGANLKRSLLAKMGQFEFQ